MKDDYCIVSEDNSLMRQYELVRNDDGQLIKTTKYDFADHEVE